MKTLTIQQIESYILASKNLKGSPRRMFMAGIVKDLGKGGRSYAHRTFGWNENTIDKGLRELESGSIPDNYSACGRMKVEKHFPNLLFDIKEIADRHSQTDPTFNTSQLFTRCSVSAIRKYLIEEYGYTNEALPHNETIRRKLNELGFRLRSVKKSEPKKTARDR
jgi:hypothetical protein